MRKILRNMAKAKMAQMGYSKINKRMRGNWREIIGAYPVNIITGQQMSKSFHGRKRNKPGSYGSLFAY